MFKGNLFMNANSGVICMRSVEENPNRCALEFRGLRLYIKVISKLKDYQIFGLLPTIP